MLQFYNTQIKPFNDELGEKLGIHKIFVRQYHASEPITVQIKTVDGDLDYCNHAGAERQEFTEYTGHGEDTIAHTIYGLECDKCLMQMIADGWTS